MWTPLYYIVAILHLFSQSLSIVLRCGGQLLNVTFLGYSRGIRWPGPIRISCRVAGLSMLYMVNLNFNHCLFSERPSASTRVRHTRAAAAAYLLEFEVSRCGTSQFPRYFLPAQVRLWNDLPFTVVDIGTVDGFKGAVNRWLLPRVVFSSVFRDAGAFGVAKAIY